MWARIKAWFKRLFTWAETEVDIVKSDFERDFPRYEHSPGNDDEASFPYTKE